MERGGGALRRPSKSRPPQLALLLRCSRKYARSRAKVTPALCTRTPPICPAASPLCQRSQRRVVGLHIISIKGGVCLWLPPMVLAERFNSANGRFQLALRPRFSRVVAAALAALLAGGVGLCWWLCYCSPLYTLGGRGGRLATLPALRGGRYLGRLGGGLLLLLLAV